MARYEAGETLSSIGRTYDCSPPAISYVVSRSRARALAATSQVVASAATAGSAPQLVKATSSGSAAPSGGARLALTDAACPTEAPARNGHAVPPRAEYRPKPHLIPSKGAQPGKGAHMTGEIHFTASVPVEQPSQPNHRSSPAYRLGGSDQQKDASRGGLQPAVHRAPAAQTAGLFGPPANGHSPPSARREGNGAGNGGNSGFIDHELRVRVEADIAAFRAAFNAALAEDTQENRSALREGTDRLLRAGAATRIEIERMEARTSLPRRSPAERQNGWEHR